MRALHLFVRRTLLVMLVLTGGTSALYWLDPTGGREVWGPSREAERLRAAVWSAHSEMMAGAFSGEAARVAAAADLLGRHADSFRSLRLEVERSRVEFGLRNREVVWRSEQRAAEGLPPMPSTSHWVGVNDREMANTQSLLWNMEAIARLLKRQGESLGEDAAGGGR